jgi:sarcosine oxidase gamma subunit
VRAAGDIFVAAAQVTNSDNFKVGGSSVGVPALGATTAPALPAGAASAISANMFRTGQSANTGDQRSRIQVDVLGYYSDGGNSCSLPDGSQDPNCAN